jgi:signal transduction histidine kinase
VAEQRAQALAEVNVELTASRDAMKKLAEVGELAASVGHELRNPLAAVRSGLAYISKRLRDPQIAGPNLSQDARIPQFLDLIEHELQASSRIISDLLDFARERPPELRECPLAPLVDEAIALVPQRAHVTLINDVAKNHPIPALDKEQFRQALINLIQNAAEAIPLERVGQVVVRAEGGAGVRWRITVADDGVGIPPELKEKIFKPLFTTKTKGTGLGLAIAAGMVERHGGTLTVDSTPGQGSTFAIELPPAG